MTQEDELTDGLWRLELAVEKVNMARRKVICSYCGCYLLMEQELDRLANAEGYEAMAKENKELAELTFELQREIVPEWD